jgi:hypothetical protein
MGLRMRGQRPFRRFIESGRFGTALLPLAMSKLDYQFGWEVA